MADGSHRLAVHQEMGRAQDREAARQDSHSPLGGLGTSAGVTLSEASAADLATVELSPDAVIPETGPLQQPEDYRS
jgi:hypothetical protein